MCRCNDNESFKLGEVDVVVMVGNGVGIGVGSHQSSGVDRCRHACPYVLCSY